MKSGETGEYGEHEFSVLTEAEADGASNWQVHLNSNFDLLLDVVDR